MKFPGVFLFLIFVLYMVPNDVTCENRSRRDSPRNPQPSLMKRFKLRPVGMLPFSLQPCNEKPQVSHATVTCGYSGCYVQCDEDYMIASSLEGINLPCDHSSAKLTFDGKPWLAEDVQCIPYCGVLGCLHGGVCTEPHKCQCQPDYRGDNCEIPPGDIPIAPPVPVVYPESCSDPDFPVVNAEVTRNGEQLVVRCSPGHEFSIGGTVAFIQCRAGRWDYPRGIFLHGGALMCQEKQCHPLARTGGPACPGVCVTVPTSTGAPRVVVCAAHCPKPRTSPMPP
ncbi:uncharacterized protein LOC123512818 [Portunus trituberculatus]|uniref:uncharacterized protein LOC123512818 n=1 Tax=Portunus trituberculatus TaxID=210409 RepID=UPI001E1CE06C|nr:uncharacterized protein LOC123512818 [Portunus trituberculatus]